jgi:hypothetical protein
LSLTVTLIGLGVGAAAGAIDDVTKRVVSRGVGVR